MKILLFFFSFFDIFYLECSSKLCCNILKKHFSFFICSVEKFFLIEGVTLLEMQLLTRTYPINKIEKLHHINAKN